MTSAFAKLALATALTVVSALGLLGLSGMIIFADLKAPQPATLASDALSSGSSTPATLTGPGR